MMTGTWETFLSRALLIELQEIQLEEEKSNENMSYQYGSLER